MNLCVCLYSTQMIEYLEASGLSEEGLLRVSGSKQRAKVTIIDHKQH